ncbi:hypothetical protein OGAPHI_006602 [Ogataea philodendri]|uniref:Uncharacterized protein n=1 Tax=Ogataea philodendri TaxID=1378263 RepID=A0A9P8NXA4_9ASCO|nr:uncharacterized protein OGAPHI_006602 [Ogataea philodendri]KAH3661195.1 hypothetical protein OGAPHI_006602 [Ogataea philodendri]
MNDELFGFQCECEGSTPLEELEELENTGVSGMSILGCSVDSDACDDLDRLAELRPLAASDVVITSVWLWLWIPTSVGRRTGGT